MILIDAGPLIALNDQGDDAHQPCVATLPSLVSGQLATTWPCFAEAVYFLGRVGGFRLQTCLWQMYRAGAVQLLDLSSDEAELAATLMEQYQDHPMDLADATLVAVAECRGWRKVFTLDTHFFAFRLRDASALDVILPKKE